MIKIYKIFKFLIFLIILGVIGYICFYFFKPLDYKYKFDSDIQIVAFYEKSIDKEEIIKDKENIKPIRKIYKKNDEKKVNEFRALIKNIKAKKYIPLIYQKNEDIVGYIKIIFSDSNFHILNSNLVTKVNIFENKPNINNTDVVFYLERFIEAFNFN